MPEQSVVLRVSDHIATLDIRRPEKHNALNVMALKGLHDALLAVREDRSVRAVVLCASGDGAFCAGGDIGEMSAMSADAAADYINLGKSCADAIDSLPSPAIAAVHGHAFGGGLELMVACDFVIAAEFAQFALPEVTLGIIPGFGGVPRLIRRVGFARAHHMVMTGDRIDAHVALKWSLVNEVRPASEVRAAAQALAARLSSYSAHALMLAKQALRGAFGSALDSGLRLETACVLKAFGHPDRFEGMAAFTERRRAQFCENQ
jgi:enoyl-CoA hydratase